MRKTKAIAILLIILVFLLGLFAGIHLFRSGRPEDFPLDTATKPAVASAEVYLFDYSKTPPQDISLSNAVGEIELSLDAPAAEITATPSTGTASDNGARYKLVLPKWQPLDNAAVQKMAESLLKLKLIKTISREKIDLKAFGFDHPQASALFTFADRPAERLTFGARINGGSQYYVMLSDKKEIYVVDKATAFLEASALTLLSKNMVTIHPEEIQSFTLARRSDGVKLGFKRVTIGDGQSDASSSISVMPRWRITSPVSWPANNSNINSMLAEYAALTPREFVSYAPQDVDRFGLDTPYYEVTLNEKNHSCVLQIGAPAAQGQRYARWLGLAPVLSINMSSLSQIDRPLLGFCKDTFCSVDISTVGQLDVSWPQNVLHCSIDVPTAAELKANPELEEQFTVNDRDADVRSSGGDHYFKRFYQSLIGLQISGLDIGAEPAYKPEIRIVYHLRLKGAANGQDEAADVKSGRGTEVGLVPRDADSYYAFINGKYSRFYIDKSQIETADDGHLGLYEAWSRLDQAMRNQHNGIYDRPVKP